MHRIAIAGIGNVAEMHAAAIGDIEDFLGALDSGEAYPLDGREARKAVAIIEAIYESAETGDPVAVETRDGSGV